MWTGTIPRAAQNLQPPFSSSAAQNWGRGGIDIEALSYQPAKKPVFPACRLRIALGRLEA